MASADPSQSAQVRTSAGREEDETALSFAAGASALSCELPSYSLQDAVLVASEELPADAIHVRGHDFSLDCTLDGVMRSMLSTGLQASALGQAVIEVNRMLDWHLGCPEDQAQAREAAEKGTAAAAAPSGLIPLPQQPPPEADPSVRTKIFLGYTSNMASAGVREHLRYLVQHRQVEVVVTTAGGVEEDLIKCLGRTVLGDWQARGAELRRRGLNRVGNLIVPNANYCAFEDWVMPILDAMLEEQGALGAGHWTPSRVIRRLGLEMDHPDSICTWAARNDIPIYCPALTDGSFGDMLYFHSFKNPGLVIDLVADIRAMNDEALKAAPRKTGILLLGGGVPKHHICNANLMRNGADFAVYLNTAQEYDGSDSGARPDEAVSWGKIKVEARPVKVHGDASILFPLLLSQTFVKRVQSATQ